MKEQLDSFLEHLALNDNASAHTVRAYESDVSQFLSFLAAHLTKRRPDLTPEDFVHANIRVVDKVHWMNTTLQDGPWDMYVEDLLSLLTIDSNGYLSNSTSTWSHPRHNDPKVDEFYARYARELDAGKRKGIAKELIEYMANNMYWNNISGSPFYMVAQPWVKGYVYHAEFEVHWDTVWLEK